MKKILIIVASLFLVGIVCCGGFLYFAVSQNAREIGDFFKLVATEDAEQFLSQCSPELAKQMDPPVLAKWMKTVNGSLGAYQDTDINGFQYNTSWENGQQKTESAGVANFEKGTANITLRTANGKMSGLEFNSKQMPTHWFVELEDTSYFHQQAKTFLQRMIDGDADALYEELHPALREVKSLDQFKSDISMIEQWGGTVDEIRVVGDAFDPIENGQVLRVQAELQGDRATLPASIKFEFTGMAAPILGYGITQPSVSE